ncbi:MAG: hypothetical protein ACI9CD_000752 [Candidatus Deianiraeaceae bacterium]|jgi:hypothetical protein
MIIRLLLTPIIAYSHYVFSGQNDNASVYQHQATHNNIPSYTMPYTHQKLHSLHSSSQHQRYIEPKVEKPLPSVPKWKKDGHRASAGEITQINNLYRHTNVHNKIPKSTFINIHLLYAPPLQVKNFSNKLQSDNIIEQSAIKQFISQYQQNINNSSDMIMDSMNFGISFSYGKRIGYDILKEWKIYLHQGRFVSNKTFHGANSTFDIAYNDGRNGVVIKYKNVEFIQRTMGVHYSIYKEFVDFLSDSHNATIRKVIPYVSAGIGVASQFAFLRLSNGGIGSGGISGGDTTAHNVFAFKPSFDISLGARYKITNRVFFDLRVSSFQAMQDINTKNLWGQSGVVFYF